MTLITLALIVGICGGLYYGYSYLRARQYHQSVVSVILGDIQSVLSRK